MVPQTPPYGGAQSKSRSKMNKPPRVRCRKCRSWWCGVICRFENTEPVPQQDKTLPSGEPVRVDAVDEQRSATR
jgi:hypothetical protein